MDLEKVLKGIKIAIKAISALNIKNIGKRGQRIQSAEDVLEAHNKAILELQVAVEALLEKKLEKDAAN